jgi:hypothetical protein
MMKGIKEIKRNRRTERESVKESDVMAKRMLEETEEQRKITLEQNGERTRNRSKE